MKRRAKVTERYLKEKDFTLKSDQLFEEAVFQLV